MARLHLPGGLLFLLCLSLAHGQPTEHLSLREAIDIALRDNPEVAGARRGIDASRARFWRGISPPPATLSVAFDYIPRGRGLNAYGERTIGVSQSIEFPSTIVLRGSSLSSTTDAAEADYLSTSLSVTLQVKLAYYGVLTKREKLLLARENRAIADDFAQKAGVRNNVGEGSALELLTAKVQKTQAHNAVEVAENELRMASNELSYALGRGKSQAGQEEFHLTDSLLYRPHLLNLEGLLELAQGANPQLQSAQFRRDAASLNRSIAWSSILPSLSVSYSRQIQGADPNLYGVAFGISCPIWFLFDQRGQIQEASAEHGRLVAEVMSTQNNVRREVNNAYLQFKSEERQVLLYTTDLLPEAREVYRAAAASYQAGEVTYVEFLQARQTLNSAQSAFIDALYRYHAAIAQLEKGIGRQITE